ncbi:ketosteroid isomerase-like protein [Dyadobacter jejuensis]|uniref:Ketosteroid isomerase-like protein n=1 Tax=Dyadobacter jejuensis TaxID=1082580 RepID=A0A316AQY9_9BACT|nr:nuclear transport factor 2 family protein [Dyadobacter jejuensis]PWJ59851.1 ketosteroid isomerase-like protein [Dyadobacter jejuensis]
MRNTLLTFVLLLLTTGAYAQSKVDQDQIYDQLNQQVAHWNNGDIAAFMEAYWPSDSLMFVGKSGVTYGYTNTYQNYLKRYPDRATMGILSFEYINMSFPSPGVAFLVGKFHLHRPEKGDASGFYTLLWRKIDGKWRIVVDHTS